MKKRILWITFFFIVAAILIYILTNPKIEKWTYDLPNHYAIKKTSETSVVLGKYVNNLFEIDSSISKEDTFKQIESILGNK